MTPLEGFLAKLSEAGSKPRRSGSDHAARCPAHDDREPSLSVGEGRDGRVLVTCHAGCQLEEIVAALGMQVSDLFGDDREQSSTVVNTYTYHDADGDPLFEVVRYFPKGFAQRLPDGRWGLNGTRPTIYRLPAVREAAQSGQGVYVVEGERDVHTLEGHGLVATCNPMGAGKWRDYYAEHLAGAHVAILPDADDAGRDHAHDVARSLHEVARSVRLVELPDLDTGGDVTDFLGSHDVEELRTLVRSAPEWQPEQGQNPPRMPTVPSTTPGTLGTLAVRKASEITPTVVRWLWDSRLAYAKLNVLGGPPGVGKSYLTAAIAAAVSQGDALPGDPRLDARPGRVLLLSYEDDPEDTLRPRLDRLGADLERVEIVEGVEDDDRRRAIGPEDVALLAAHAEAAGDVALVIVDPVSAFVGAGTDEHRGNEVRAALEDLRVHAQDYGFAVLLVMHTRKSAADTALNRLAGSQAYGALVRSALMAGPIPDDENERHAIAHVKHNLAAKQPTLAYSVDGEGVHWHGEIDLDAEEVAGHADGAERSAGEEAAAFLNDLLADGPVPAKTVLREAEDAAIAERTLKRAKSRLGVVSRRTGDRWTWSVPGTPNPGDECAAEGCTETLEVFDHHGTPWCATHCPAEERWQLSEETA